MTKNSLIITLCLAITVLSCGQQHGNIDYYLQNKDFMANLRFELNEETIIPDPVTEGLGNFPVGNRFKKIEELQKYKNDVVSIYLNEFDSAGKLIYTTYDRERKSQPVHYFYDEAGRLTTMVDTPRIFLYKYDSTGRTALRELKGKYIDHFKYTDTSVIIERTEWVGIDIASGSAVAVPNMRTIQVIRYNELKLPVYKSHSMGSIEDWYTYDKGGNLLLANMNGSGTNVTHKLQYDKNGLLIKKEVFLDGKATDIQNLTYAFNLKGRHDIAVEVEREWLNLQNPGDNKKTVLHYVFDNKGNWIKKTEENNPVETVRNIEYY